MQEGRKEKQIEHSKLFRLKVRGRRYQTKGIVSGIWFECVIIFPAG
jgi:hypothetical protein